MTVTPLISDTQTLPALERIVAAARSELLMSLRALDPATPLVSPELIEQGLGTWADLIAAKTQGGVCLRMLFGDRDPLFAPDLHRRAWLHASGFADAVQGDSQIICAQHGQLARGPWAWMMRGKIKPRIKTLRSEDPVRLTPPQRAIASAGRITLHPALFHQHFVVADGMNSMLGGLGLGGARDVSVQISDADFAGALHGHFAECWNRAIEAKTHALANHPVHMDTTVRAQGRADLRPLRSFTVPLNRWSRLAPLARVTEHESTLFKLINTSRKLIILQTEALTCRRLVDKLRTVAVMRKDLKLVLITSTGTPESWDADHLKDLQDARIRALQSTFGDRVFVAKADLPGGSVAIFDDQSAVVGSANLTARSMRWDCEVSALVRDPQTVRRLRDQLVALWLGDGVDAHDLSQWHGAITSGVLGAYNVGAPGRKRARLPEDMF
ncbi:MAG: phospholipase D-like domain-containing protein [Pelagimonas sp.]|jgi:phospholipase D1/2|nr:phospholipase D-like domain-containing protein [Pelagimonas sp.]